MHDRRPVPGPTPSQIRNRARMLEHEHGWAFTRRAVDQMATELINPGTVVHVAAHPEVRNPARGDVDSLWGNKLLLLVSRTYPRLVIAVTRRDIPPPPDPAASGPPRGKSGRAGRKMPSNTKEFTDMLLDKGFEVVPTGNGHLKVTHPDRTGFTEYCASTGSDHRGLSDSIARIRRITGLDPTA